jgi:ABC-type protease/lipase transport system fused ATPase/permease subunit
MTHRVQSFTKFDLLMVIENGTVTDFGARDEVLQRMQPVESEPARAPRSPARAR